MQGYRTCKQKNATPELLYTLIGHNLDYLEAQLHYNQSEGINLFRISSDIIPFGSSPVNTLLWWEIFEPQFERLAAVIAGSQARVSMHPGQYTVLNSPNSDVVERAVADLAYHAQFLDALQTNSEHKIILHVGGVYGDRPEAMARFATQYEKLPTNVLSRLVIENDDKSYPIGDVLELGHMLHIPVVYDNLHNAVLATDRSVDDKTWIREARATWSKQDGNQKIHYSQQDSKKRAGSHSESIEVSDFVAFYEQLAPTPPDVMLEVKDKNRSAVACVKALKQISIDSLTKAGKLQAEWK
jgi:UV DNA damage endonuclease